MPNRSTLHGMWQGETAFIIGGGPSLIDFDFSPIMDRKVIGVNNSYRFGPWVDVCWFGDLKWFHWHQLELREKYEGIICHCNTRSNLIKLNWIVPFERGAPVGIETKKGTVAWNRCSGLSAINLAYHFGVTRVVLLGFDMRMYNIPGRRGPEMKNWHTDHKEQVNRIEARRRFNHHISACKIIQKAAVKLNFEIINCTLESAIPDFPIMSLDDFLAQEKNQ